MTTSASQQISAEYILAAGRGEQCLMDWTQDGTLLEVDKIELAWGVNSDTVSAALASGDIFSVWIKGKHWYPSELLKFERAALAAINRALDGTDPSSKLLFFLRKHGGLDGKTPAEAVVNGKFNDVLRVANEWVRT